MLPVGSWVGFFYDRWFEFDVFRGWGWRIDTKCFKDTRYHFLIWFRWIYGWVYQWRGVWFGKVHKKTGSFSATVLPIVSASELLAFRIFLCKSNSVLRIYRRIPQTSLLIPSRLNRKWVSVILRGGCDFKREDASRLTTPTVLLLGKRCDRISSIQGSSLLVHPLDGSPAQIVLLRFCNRFVSVLLAAR